jgi:hypothetical protein
VSGVSFPLVRKCMPGGSSDAVPKPPCRVRERVRSVLSLRQAALRFRGPSRQEKGLEGFSQAAVVFAVQRAYLTPSKITVALSDCGKHAPRYARVRTKRRDSAAPKCATLFALVGTVQRTTQRIKPRPNWGAVIVLSVGGAREVADA